MQSPRAMRRWAVLPEGFSPAVPPQRGARGVGRARGSARAKGPAVPAGRPSLSFALQGHAVGPGAVAAGAAIGGCVEGQQHQPALPRYERHSSRHSRRGGRPQRCPRGWKGAGGNGRLYVLCERGLAMPPCQSLSPTVLPSERARRDRSTCRVLLLSRARLRRTLVREGVCDRAAACVCGRGQRHQVEWQKLAATLRFCSTGSRPWRAKR